MKPSSEKRLQQLHPALASRVRAMVADLAAQGTVVEVVQGLRTFAEQDELYAKGRTKPGAIVTQARGGESNHNYGLAVDLCPFTNDKPDWNAPMGVWAAIGAAAAAHGLEWGGQWKKFLDKPHVQLPAMTVRECARCYQAGGLDSVWVAAAQKIGWTEPLGAAPRLIQRRRTGGKAASREPGGRKGAASRARSRRVKGGRTARTPTRAGARRRRSRS